MNELNILEKVRRGIGSIGLRLAMLGLIGIFSPISANAGTANIDVSTAYQTIDGFGFATAWSGTMSNALAQTAFGTGDGQMGATIIRERIDPNFDEVHPDFDWQGEAANSVLAHAHGAKVLASEWTPPINLKSNDAVDGGSLLSTNYSAYVTYLNQAIAALNPDFVSIQNEPDFDPGANGGNGYESCLWTPDQFDTFFANYAQGINRPLVMPESFQFRETESDQTLNDPSAVSNVSRVGEHIYGAGPFIYSAALNHKKPVWMTEHFNNGFDIASCMVDAKEINDCMTDSMSAYIWWWAYFPGSASDMFSGSTLLKNGEILAQFSKYIRPGYVRVNSTYNPSANIYTSAYTGNGNVVIVALNTGTSTVSQQFTMAGGSSGSLVPHQTDANEDDTALASVSMSNGSFTTTLPAQSVTTFVQTIHSFSTGLRMITVPFNYNGASFSSIFNPSPKLAAWDPANNIYDVTPVGLANSIVPGQGYWVRVGGSLSLLSAGSSSPSSSTPYNVPLSAGWNLIGDPFTSPVLLSTCTVTDSSNQSVDFVAAVTHGLIGADLFTYNPVTQGYDSLTQASTIQPFTGYWIYAYSPCTVVFP